MRFHKTALSGAWLIEPEPQVDERGSFARTFCSREFAGHGLVTHFVQCSTSLTRRRGTIRGLHYQRAPAVEAKLVRCTAGAIYDVVVDLRPDSPTFRQHLAVELSAANGHALYVPPLCAHGFQALHDNAEVLYQISEYYAPEHATGLRPDDPALGLTWPLPVTLVSPKDRQWALLENHGSPR
jgi:dTDP-4-dehydrorhamnose 3,5-epimerase